MADYDAFQWGGVSFPLTAATTNAALRDADPALFYALEYLSFCITKHVGARMLAEATLCRAPIASAVAMRLPYDPEPFLLEEQIRLPLLAIVRSDGSGSYITTSLAREKTRWSLLYAMPCLAPAQAERLVPLLHAVEIVLAQRIEQGWDPDYTPTGGTLGEQAWHRAGIDRIDVEGVAYGSLPGTDAKVFFPCLTMTLAVTERRMPLSGTPLQGIDTSLGVKDASGTTPNVVQINTSTNVPAPGGG